MYCSEQRRMQPNSTLTSYFSLFPLKYPRQKPFPEVALLFRGAHESEGGGLGTTLWRTTLIILFSIKLPCRCAFSGKRCGRSTFGRNQRARRALLLTSPEAIPRHMVMPLQRRETTAEAPIALDAQFPWLGFAEK